MTRSAPTVPPAKTRAPMFPAVTRSTVRDHLADMHQMPDVVLADATVDELLAWHTAEHRTRLHDTLEFLGHRHPKATSEHAQVIDQHLQDLTRRAARHAGGRP